MIPNTRAGAPDQPDSFSDEAEEAYHAFAALRRAVQDQPSLTLNKYFLALQDTAYARFLMAFEAI